MRKKSIALATVVLTEILALAGCSTGFNAIMGSVYIDPNVVAGLPSSATVRIVIDNDLDVANGGIAGVTATVENATNNGVGAVPYSFIGVPPGDYYVYAFIDLNGGGLGTVGDGDAWGYYGRASFAAAPSQANAYKVTVADPGALALDIGISNPASWM